MKHRIVKKIRRAEAGVIETLGRLGVATVHEAQGRRGLMAPYMRPIYPTARVVGSAVTISSQPGDNLMIHAAVEVCKPGDVLVVTCKSPSTDGMFGELIATSLMARGVKGLIIDAGVRDVADLTAMNFPVWSKAVHAHGTVKATPGSVNVPVVCAGETIYPGDVIIGDVDGVCVVRRQDAEAVAKSGQSRLEKEASSRAKLKAGELSLDFNKLRAKCIELGVVWVDEE